MIILLRSRRNGLRGSLERTRGKNVVVRMEDAMVPAQGVGLPEVETPDKKKFVPREEVKKTRTGKKGGRNVQVKIERGGGAKD